MLKYGFQLALVEILTICSIYLVKVIIDFLQNREAPFIGYAIFLFSFFTLTRLFAVFIRNYYDLHVYNYFRFVQTAIQAWIFEDVSKLRLWSKIGCQDQK